jgi:hypothetical protein
VTEHRRAPRGLRFEAPERGAGRIGNLAIDRITPRRPIEHDCCGAVAVIRLDAHRVIEMLDGYHRYVP